MLTSSSVAVPRLGIPGLIENWRSDLLSGFLVFLIALPLCLGIAMASGFPPMSGIISAIIGGVVVSRINGSYMTINGPAAGLIVVIVDAVQSLGQGDAMAGYRYTLAAIVVASVLQVLMGIFKAGKLSAFFPSSVVHGMLAAIGIIIMAKQIHTLLGVKPEAKSLFGTIAEVPHSLMEMNPEVSVIGLLGLLLLILWSVIKHPTLKMIPAPLLVVLMGLVLGQFFDLDHIHQYLFLPDAEILPHHQFTVGPSFLVAVPENFMAGFYFPDFSKIATVEFWISVITIWLVGSLESLLSASAVDKLDPYKRNSNLNRDLTAVGIGNLVSGMVGGLPMIAEIVRSSANINNGAKTAWANFFHGVFLLIFVALFPKLIHEIPLSALAALLVFTGFRLASPREFAKMLAVGLDHFAVFVITILGVLATDLLIGVAIGIVVELAIHVSRGLKLRNAFSMAYQIDQTDDDTYHIEVSGAAVFSNIITLKSLLADFPQRKTVYFDLSETDLIDHTVMEFIHHFAGEYNHNGGHCEIVGLDQHESYSDHHLSARRKIVF
ncbi:SulP family inorganic anion transporter [Methylomonas sp. LL1]|uniref:SulP family inorganic anion transporter n=1 Tax=Methylomonas sp. LL1 TaxID=2785785 RepID=UPI0018C3ED1B|nr:SulP family inorganic anion transporter [Methylomonas sp. LL1]QPK61732.1 SulP family inorganic anion transporter [Methylomonas sp. LL1]